MSNSPSPTTAIGEVEVQLLDPASGRPIKSWTFTNQAQITIGRSPEQDVDVIDPYVSRNHANLAYRDGQWLLVPLGRHGVVVENQLLAGEYAVSGEVRFGLGTEGPKLRFQTAVVKSAVLATICFDEVPVPLFQLDEHRVKNDVEEIVEGDFFQNLQQRAKQLRRRNNAD